MGARCSCPQHNLKNRTHSFTHHTNSIKIYIKHTTHNNTTDIQKTFHNIKEPLSSLLSHSSFDPSDRESLNISEIERKVIFLFYFENIMILMLVSIKSCRSDGSGSCTHLSLMKKPLRCFKITSIVIPMLIPT